jgi:hypothetical protein
MTIRPTLRRPIEAVLRHRQTLGRVLCMGALAAIMFATLMPSPQTLTSVRWCVVCGSLGGVDVVLNVLLFVPLGCGLAMAGIRPVRALAAMALLTLTIESLQFTLIEGRDASIGDLLTNSVGGAIGFGIGASIAVWLTPSVREATRLALLWLCVWIIVQGVASYSLVPATTSPWYYGQIKRALFGRPAYAGDVPLATIDGQPIPNMSYDKAGLLPPALGKPDGALVRVDVVPRGPTRRPEPIVRIANESLEEVLVVAQQQTNLVFGIRTGAGVLRLRPIYFALRDVFPRSESGARRDTIRIEARYSARELQLQADDGVSHREVRIPLSPALGWRLFLPRRSNGYGEPRDAVVAVLWLMLLLAPVGYWHACSMRRTPHEGPSRRTVARLVVPLGVLAGLIGVPAAFGLGLPGAVEWVGAALAIGAGAVTARLVLRA